MLILTRTLPPGGQGGLAAAAADLASAVVRAGAEVRIMAPAGLAASCPAGAAFEAVDAPPDRYSPAWWRGSARAFDRMGSGRFDVVLGVSAAANALAAGRRSDGPLFLFQAHGTSVGEVASRLRSRRPRTMAGAVRNLYWGLARDRAYRDYDAVVAVGSAVQSQLAAWPTRTLLGATPVHLVRNGVDATAFRFDPRERQRLRSALGAPDDVPVAVFAGRLQADKGPLQALEAVALAMRRRPELILAFLGEGPERERLQRRAAALGLAGRVHLPGHVARAELPGWFSAADTLVFPTRRAEGLPLVVLEALASGLPVLTTARGAGDPELPCVRLAPDDLQEFAGALCGVSTAQVRGSRLPEAFHLHYSAQAYLALFEQLLCARTRPTAGRSAGLAA